MAYTPMPSIRVSNTRAMVWSSPRMPAPRPGPFLGARSSLFSPFPGGNKAVQLKHGNFISTYYNLSTIYVKKGDRVDAKTVLGDIYTNRSNGQTRLKFYLHQNTSKLNPEEWVYQL